MIDINKLVAEGAHEEIANIENPKQTNYKAIALIYTDRYDEALKYLDLSSFEAAYCYYKLKNFRKAAKILKKKSDVRSRILLSQVLYFLGYYNTAYEILEKVDIDDEIAVNLQAMKNFAILANKNRTQIPSKCTIREKDALTEFRNLNNHKFGNPESCIEFVYNDSFQYLDNQKSYVNYLESLLKEDSSLQGSIIDLQYKNITGAFDEIDESLLLKNQKKVLEFNKKQAGTIEDPLHFQINVSDAKEEYYWFMRSQNMKYDINFNTVPALSPNLRILRSFLAIKNGRNSKGLVERNLKSVPDCEIKRLLLLLDKKECNSKDYLRSVILELSSE